MSVYGVAMVRKGLSVEEKRDKILAIYHSTKAIYNLRDIEKAASKQGVTVQTVKVRVTQLHGKHLSAAHECHCSPASCCTFGAFDVFRSSFAVTERYGI